MRTPNLTRSPETVELERIYRLYAINMGTEAGDVMFGARSVIVDYLDREVIELIDSLWGGIQNGVRVFEPVTYGKKDGGVPMFCDKAVVFIHPGPNHREATWHIGGNAREELGLYANTDGVIVALKHKITAISLVIYETDRWQELKLREKRNLALKVETEGATHFFVARSYTQNSQDEEGWDTSYLRWDVIDILGNHHVAGIYEISSQGMNVFDSEE